MKFSLRSTELRNYEIKHICTTVEVVTGNKILVKVDPPFPGHYYGSKSDFTQFVLAPRHEGAYLTPEISEWPCRVHICIPNEDGNWNAGPFRSLDWGIIEEIEND